MFDLDRGLCVGCGHKMARGGDAWSWQAHHVIKQQVLRARGLQPKWWRGPALCVLLCRRCHERHESRTAPVPWERLPERIHYAVGLLGPWAVDLLERYHPHADVARSA